MLCTTYYVSFIFRRYIEYSNAMKQWRSIDNPTWSFCGRSEVARHVARAHGYIVFLSNGLLIDELFVLELQAMYHTDIYLTTIEPAQKVIRISDHRYNVENQTDTSYIDIYVPRAFHEPEDRLASLVDFLNQLKRGLPDHLAKSRLQEIESLFVNKQSTTSSVSQEVSFSMVLFHPTEMTN